MVRRRPGAAPGARGTCPRPAGRRRPSGRSSPWATSARSSASAAGCVSPVARASPWICADAADGLLQRAGHELVHLLRVVAFDEEGLPAAAAQELPELLIPDAGQDGGVADLVAVQVQDRQHGPVADGVEELGGLPGGGQRAGLGLAVADDAGDDQAGIVERGAERVAERVPQLAALVDRSRASSARRGWRSRRGTRTG